MKPSLGVRNGSLGLNVFVLMEVQFRRWCNTWGWTSNIHRQERMSKIFIPSTREKANGRKRLFFCGVHGSHMSAKPGLDCIENNIILFFLPPHSSHLLQPLDVIIFGPLKIVLRTGIRRLKKEMARRLFETTYPSCELAEYY
jgi:hypothetical protein